MSEAIIHASVLSNKKALIRINLVFLDNIIKI